MSESTSATIADGDPAGRRIYAYPKGDGTTIHADPIALDRRLRAAGRGRGEGWIALQSRYARAHRDYVRLLDAGRLDGGGGDLGPTGADPGPSPDDATDAYIDARTLVADVAREAFDLAPFDRADGSGATESEALDRLNDFLVWLEKKATNTAS